MTSKMLQSSNTYEGTDPPLVNDPKDPATMIWPATLLIKIKTATKSLTPLKLTYLTFEVFPHYGSWNTRPLPHSGITKLKVWQARPT